MVPANSKHLQRAAGTNSSKLPYFEKRRCDNPDHHAPCENPIKTSTFDHVATLAVECNGITNELEIDESSHALPHPGSYATHLKAIVAA
ncbi:MAG: hypothetical protein CBD74_02390 [Saprospirales bacterium TMED214]|nr:MAG: hypothetical protein CBD74_02390 [Saprospirales bacterium TMED214]